MSFNNDNQNPDDKKYYKIGVVVFVTVVAIYVACSLVKYIPLLFYELFDGAVSFLDIMYPVILGFALAYLLLIPTRAIENFLLTRKHFPIKNRTACRAIGVVVTYITVLATITTILVGIYYMIGGQISKNTTLNNIYKTIEAYFTSDNISPEYLQKQIEKLNLPFSDLLSSKADDIANILSNIISFLFGSVISIGGSLFNIVIALILSIYFILSYEYFQKFINKFFYAIFKESRLGSNIKSMLRIINDTFSAYIRGQLIEAFIVAVLSSIVLAIIGVEYAVVIGVITGICNLIPYVGPLIGTILAGIVALLGGDIFTCIWAIVGMQVVQQLDANVICPRVVGNIVGLPAAFVIIAILIGGDFAGLLGMLIAVPVAASLKALSGAWFDKHFSGFDTYYEQQLAAAEMAAQEKRSENEILKAERKLNRKQKINAIKNKISSFRSKKSQKTKNNKKK